MARSTSHSRDQTCCLGRSQYVAPYPVIRHVYTYIYILPAEWHSWKTILVILRTFFLRPIHSKRSVRVSKARYRRPTRVNVIRLLSTQKYATKHCIDHPRPYGPAFSSSTTITQWRMMSSMIALNILGNMGSTCVTLWNLLRGSE